MAAQGETEAAPEGPPEGSGVADVPIELLRAAFELAPIGMTLVDRDGRITRANNAFGVMLGYEPDELRGVSMLDLTHPDDRADTARSRTRLFEGELDSFELEKRFVHRDGHVVWTQLSVTALRDDLGSPVCTLGQVRDITERRAAEEALNRRDPVLRAVALAAERLLQAPSWYQVIDDVLREIGVAIGAAAVSLHQNTRIDDGTILTSITAEWTAPGGQPRVDDPERQREPFRAAGYEDWADALLAGRTFASAVSDLSPDARSWYGGLDIGSFADAPVLVGGSLWGWIGVDHRDGDRIWSAAEREGLGIAASVLAAAIERNQSESLRLAAEERYGALVETLPLTVYVEDIAHAARGRELPWEVRESMVERSAGGAPGYISPRIVDVLGYTLEEWDTPFFAMRIAHPDDRHLFEEPWPDEAGPHRYEYRLIARDGRVVWFQDEYIVLMDEQGVPQTTQGYMLDVTERRAMEEALRTTNETLTALVDASPVAIIVVDAAETVSLWNRAAEQMYGWAADEVIGQPLPIRPPEREGEVELLHRVAARGGHVDGYETRRRRKDGRQIDVRISVAPLRDRDGNAVGVLGVHLDITAAKRAERALREREQRFRAVFDAANDALAIVDDDRRYVEINEAGVHLHGLARDELLGRELDELLDADALAALDAAWRSALDTGAHAGELDVQRADGSTRHVELALKAHFLPGRHLLTWRDVTDTKALEAQLFRSQQMEAVGRLAGGVAHDFNNILTAVQGYAGFLLEALDNGSPERADAEEIARAADRAAALVRQLLAFSRRQLLRPVALSLNAVLRDTEAMLRRLIGEDITLVTELTEPLPAISADPAQLEQIVINLAVNARDAMPDGGSLVFRTSPAHVADAAAARLAVEPGQYVLLEVADTGVGMDDETRERVFEPFFTTRQHGTGLGLSTVYGIVTQSGGHVQVASSPGAGTTFSILLPGTASPVEPDPVTASAAPAAGGAETVLLVEDERVVRDLAERILTASGYAVLCAGSGEEALQMAAEHVGTIALLLTDVVMPGMSGVELADRLRPERPGARTVFMSGYAEEALFKRGIPPDRTLLAKPFTPETLRSQVRRALDERPARAPAP